MKPSIEEQFKEIRGRRESFTQVSSDLLNSHLFATGEHVVDASAITDAVRLAPLMRKRNIAR